MPKVTLTSIFKAAYDKWSADRASELGAALAFYGTFSLVPLIILAIKFCSLFFGEAAARGTIVSQIQNAVGPSMAQSIESLLKTARADTHGALATAIGIITMLVGASGMFVQLRNSLNLIWGVAPQSEQGVWSTIRSQLIAFAMVAMCALLLLGTLLLSAVLTTMGSWITDTLHVGELPLHFANFVFSFVLVATLVALIFKFVSAANISWADAWRGALLFSLLFVIGKVLIGLYLGRSGVSSAFGAAGSVILLMLWVYYSSQMLFFGAEFAGVYAELRGRRIEPQPIHIPKHAT